MIVSHSKKCRKRCLFESIRLGLLVLVQDVLSSLFGSPLLITGEQLTVLANTGPNGGPRSVWAVGPLVVLCVSSQLSRDWKETQVI